MENFPSNYKAPILKLNQHRLLWLRFWLRPNDFPNNDTNLPIEEPNEISWDKQKHKETVTGKQD